MMMKWRSSYYFRLVLSYTVLALVLISITGGYLLTNANQMMTSEVSKDARYGLLNAKDVVENNFLRFYEDAFFNKVLMTVNKDSNEEIKYLLENPAQGNMSRIVRFIADLQIIKYMTPGLDGITVYMRNGGYAMDNDHYYESPNNSADTEFIQTLANIRPNHWFMREKPDSQDHKVMTYVFPLPYYSTPATATGFLYIDISLAHMNAMVRNLANSSQSHLYMFDENGRIVMGEENASAEEVAAVQSAMMRSVSQKSSDALERYENSVIAFLPQSDSLNRWSYAIVRPVDSFLLFADKMKTHVWKGSMIALLGGVIISFLMSRHFYMPLKKLLYSIRNLYNGPTLVKGGHEYATIDHMLMFIDLSMLQMKDQVRMKQISGLITGQQTVAGFGSLPAIPLECNYSVAYIVTEPEGGEAMARFLGEQAGLKAELVSMSATELALLVFIYDNEMEDAGVVSEVLETMRPSLQGIVMGAGIGSVVKSVETIHQSYQEAVQAYKYSYVYGKEAIIMYDDISVSRETLIVPNIGYDQLQNKIQAGNVNEVERWFEELAHTLRNELLSVETIELISLRSSAILSQVVIEQKLHDLFPIIGFHEKIKQPTMDLTIALLQEQAVSIAKHIHEGRNDAHIEKIVQLKAFIGDHMSDDLTLDELAGRVNLSANYVSTLFGSISGESFTEYLNRIRLERAASLLVTDRNLSVAEVATAVGYRNSQYFCTKFKSKFGITPLQYRGSGKLQESLAK
ncbi:MAG: hypothetical protein K0Q73_5545 [Paenibacillus sp.]|nr:hypothetical protein [Paenibacillus sp.]